MGKFSYISISVSGHSTCPPQMIPRDDNHPHKLLDYVYRPLHISRFNCEISVNGLICNLSEERSSFFDQTTNSDPNHSYKGPHACHKNI
jgi:hypothetical protein